jgi:hypothetical protein
MTKRRYVYRDGEVIEDVAGITEEAKSAFVHQDTLEKPLKDLVTGKMYDSKSALLDAYKARGSRVVGNDWVGDTTPTGPKDQITDEKIMKAIHQAEAIQRDPARRRAWQATERRKAIAQQQFLSRGRV